MATRLYKKAGLTLSMGHPDIAQTKSLQRDLRALGYLESGIDGAFGTGTSRAVQSISSPASRISTSRPFATSAFAAAKPDGPEPIMMSCAFKFLSPQL